MEKLVCGAVLGDLGIDKASEFEVVGRNHPLERFFLKTFDLDFKVDEYETFFS